MTEDFSSAMEQLLKEYDIQLPKSYGTDEQRARYRNYLAKVGLSEDDVAPIIDRTNIPPEANAQLILGFTQAVKNKDKKLLTLTIDMMASIMLEHNTNQLIGRLVYRLWSDISIHVKGMPEFYAGVYPTGSINAHCVFDEGLALLFINTGCFEMVEAAMMAFVSKRNETEQAQVIINILEDYIRGHVPDSRIANHPSIDWGAQIVPIFSTAVEEFVIAHELGHLALGHLYQENTIPTKNIDSFERSSQKRTQSQEYQADVWALQVLVDRAKQNDDASFALDLSCSGVMMFLYIGLMIEAMAESRRVPIKDTHPPIEHRIYVAEVTFELLGMQEHLGFSRKFRRLVRELCVLEGVEARFPPLLARDLNVIVVETYNSLKIDYSHVSFLRDFI